MDSIQISRKQKQAIDLAFDPQMTELLLGGAAGGSKSWTVCQVCVMAIRKFPGIRIFIGRKTLKSLKQSTIATLIGKVHPALGITYNDYTFHGQDMTIDYKNGSQIIFGELDFVPSDPDYSRWGSLEIDFGVIEEAGEVVEGAFSIVKSRSGRGVMTKKYGIPGFILATCNPSQNFLRTKFYDPYEKLGGGDFQCWEIGEVDVQGEKKPSYRGFLRMGAYDNPFLPQSYIDNLKTLPDIQRRRLLDGDWNYADDESSLFRAGLLDKAMCYELPESSPENTFVGCDISDLGSDKTVFSLIKNGVLVNQKTSSVQMNWEKDSKLPMGKMIANELVEFAQRNGIDQRFASHIAVEINGVGASCLPAGELITTTKKKIAIENVQKEDILYSKDGKPTKIKQLLDYNYNGNIYEIIPYGFKYGHKFTEEHPIWASKTPSPKKGIKEGINHNFKWWKASEIEPLMWIKEKNVYQEIHPMPDFSNYDFCLKPNRYASKTEQQSVNKIVDDKDFWWVVGYWLGDGWLQNLDKKGEIHFCYNLQQLEFQQKVEKWVKKINRKATHYRKPAIENSVIRCHNLARWFYDNFGEKAKGKYIPEWVKFIPREYKIALLQGYFDSDGTNGLHPSKGQTIYRMGWSSVNYRLLEDIKCILDSLELSSCIQERTLKKGYKPGVVGYTLCLGSYASVSLNHLFEPDCKLLKVDYLQKLHNRRQYCYYENGWIYRQINKVKTEQYTGKVYNFSTEDETFMAGRIPTHNCRDFLRERGWQITEYIATHKSRSENYYNLMMDMDAGDVKIYQSMEGIDELRRELMAHSFELINQEPSVVKKDKIKQTIGHSPDFADSFQITNYARRLAEHPELNPHTNSRRIVW